MPHHAHCVFARTVYPADPIGVLLPSYRLRCCAGALLASHAGRSVLKFTLFKLCQDKLAACAGVHRLATALRARGCEVVELAWGQSEHCGHFRRHPEAYREGVHTLLSRAQVRKKLAMGYLFVNGLHALVWTHSDFQRHLEAYRE
eukprot:scaffold86445_cov19-Tisochrysis_lutea.AAC.2